MTERQARDEGAQQTKLIMDAVKRARMMKGWSAQQLAEKMTAAGIPWNSSVVENLEYGRRKSLRVHELIALAFILDAPKPLELLVPGDEQYPVTPGLLHDPAEVRAWLRGESGPLRRQLGATVPPGVLELAAQLFDQQGQLDLAAAVRRTAGLLAGGDRGTS